MIFAQGDLLVIFECDKSVPYIQQVFKNKILRVLYCRPESEPLGKSTNWIDASKESDIQNRRSEPDYTWKDASKESSKGSSKGSTNWIDASKEWDKHNKWDCGRSPIRWDDNNVNDANAVDVAKITKIKVSSLDPGHVGCQMLKMLVVFQRSRKLNQCSAHFQLRSGSS